MERKLKTLSWLFLITIISLILSQIIVWENINEFFPHIEEKIKINNQGLLALSGIAWWENQTALLVFQVFMLLVTAAFAIGFPYILLVIVEAITILPFCIFEKKAEEKESCFFYKIPDAVGDLVITSPSGWWAHNCYYEKYENSIIFFLKILLWKIIFLIISPIMITLWVVKWTSYSLFLLSKKAV